jgi:hypothetical protein
MQLFVSRKGNFDSISWVLSKPPLHGGSLYWSQGYRGRQQAALGL